MSLEFVNVTVNTSSLYAAKTRDYGTVAIVGVGNNNGSAPQLVGSYGEANTLFADTDLGKGVKLAFMNGASQVWTVDCASKTTGAVETALAALEAVDAQIVVLANIVEADDAQFISQKLLYHVNGGSDKSTPPATERIGIFMLAKGATTVINAIDSLGTNESRLFGIAHNSDDDVACAVAGLLASLKPWESPLLKSLVGVSQATGYTTSIQKAFETAQINVLVTPTFLAGHSYTLGSDFTLGPSGLQFIDTRRVVDDLAYKLKAGLTSPAIIGQLQINKSGLSVLMGKIAGLMQTMVNIGEIEDYQIIIPVLNALCKDVNSRTDGDTAIITSARTSRGISGTIIVTYAGVLHTIDITVDMTA
jgi:hypothetical protein